MRYDVIGIRTGKAHPRSVVYRPCVAQRDQPRLRGPDGQLLHSSGRTVRRADGCGEIGATASLRTKRAKGEAQSVSCSSAECRHGLSMALRMLALGLAY